MVSISWHHQVDGLVQQRRNSSALAMGLRLSCTNPLMCNISAIAGTSPKEQLIYLHMDSMIYKLRTHFSKTNQDISSTGESWTDTSWIKVYAEQMPQEHCEAGCGFRAGHKQFFFRHLANLFHNLSSFGKFILEKLSCCNFFYFC